jgi:outer membrane protein TolC
MTTPSRESDRNAEQPSFRAATDVDTRYDIPKTADNGWSIGKPLVLSTADSILMALENNQELRVQRISPQIRQRSEDLEKSAFDPILSSRWTGSRTVSPGGNKKSVNNSLSGDLSLQTLLPTGTSIGVGVESGISDPSFDSDASTRLGVDINQSLLRGMGTGVNLASLRQARLDTITSEFELWGYAESLIATVEKTYWNYYLAHRNLEIVQQSLEVAEKQLEETSARIKLGKTAEIELAAAKAEVSLRRESLINARSTLETTRLELLRLLNPSPDEYWSTPIKILDRPPDKEQSIEEVERHVEYAMRMRPDLNQARLSVERGDLEIVKTRNGLLPKLDFFINLGGTGYAGSFENTFGKLDSDFYDVRTGLTFEYPLGNRAAEARHRLAVLSREQTDLSLTHLAQTIQVDVRSAYIEVNRTKEQIEATRSTRLLQEENYRSESEKFRVGKSTSLLVAASQRDLLSSRIEEVKAIVNHQIALIDLYRLEGSLLIRRGITANFVESDGRDEFE